MAFGAMSGSYLGVDIDEVTSDRVAALKLKEERGVEITNVDQDAPAGKAGLKEQDVIVGFNGQRVEGREQFTRFIRETPAGRTVTLDIVRDGQPMQIKATLADRQKEWASSRKNRIIRVPTPEVPDFDIEIPEIQFNTTTVSTSTGLSVDNLTPQLAQYFGVKSGSGILVKSVEKNSPAEKAGIKAGDVVVKVDSETIESRSDYRQAIRHRNADTVKVTVIRNKAEQVLTMNVPSSKRDSSQKRSGNSSDVEDAFAGDFEVEIAHALPQIIDLRMDNLNELVRGSVDEAFEDGDCDSTD
jgi:S1-C subfamily serine protease